MDYVDIAHFVILKKIVPIVMDTIGSDVDKARLNAIITELLVPVVLLKEQYTLTPNIITYQMQNLMKGRGI
ncbi:hypothetical protein Ga0061065_12050 [Marinomonas fungiae]|uniref:Uncharacterized protein n=1 Tax=Marinomonas fungiae TaxID=1137284 RepID=A0A0K6IU89_9GAMM|nr:hypothetical protein Ga0061065_12050 [Marinomonas fungiae]